jgi:hypothetical protein
LVDTLSVDAGVAEEVRVDKRAVEDEVEEEAGLIGFVVPEQVPKAGLQLVWQYADVLPHHPYLLGTVSKMANAHE